MKGVFMAGITIHDVSPSGFAVTILAKDENGGMTHRTIVCRDAIEVLSAVAEAMKVPFKYTAPEEVTEGAEKPEEEKE